MSRRKDFQDLLEQRVLQTCFRPVLDVRQARLYGYMGTVCGPEDSRLESYQQLLDAATRYEALPAFEALSLDLLVRAFMSRHLPGKLFVRLSVQSLINGIQDSDNIRKLMNKQEMSRDRIVLEVFEYPGDPAVGELVASLAMLREKGFHFALDNVGDGLGCLRLWARARPDFIRLGGWMTHRIDEDVLKLQFVRALKQMADVSQTHLLAECIETAEELRVLKTLGICLAQGDFVGKLQENVREEAITCIDDSRQMMASSRLVASRSPRATSLLMEVPTVTVKTSSEDALQILIANPEQNVLPVLDGNRPVGLLGRDMVDKFSHGYMRDLYALKSCTVFMDKHPLVVEAELSIVELSELVIQKGNKHFGDGFIIVRDGMYAGVGSNFDLMQAMTRLQLKEARYANPLTLLPGNVPIQEHMQHLLDNRQPFWVAYADLDFFKPFNDVFGYEHGDAVIRLLGDVLVAQADKTVDFVGHIGGDDFFVIYQTDDWEQRCQNVLQQFDAGVQAYAQQKGLGDGKYQSEDRQGNVVSYCLPTVSIGVVPATSDQFHNVHEISTVAAEVKKAAKRIAGSSLYVDRRVTKSDL
jgi:diguanylate cyclase (GGDEF)-like protein